MNFSRLLLAVLPCVMLGCASNDSLQGKLDQRKAQWKIAASEHTKQTYDDGIQAIKDSGVLETAKNVGDKAPDFSLPDTNAQQVQLSKLLADGPVIVVFYRGEWCPYCNITLTEWQDHADEVHKLGGQLVAISPQLPEYSFTSQQKNNLTFPVLSDVDFKVSDAFGITTQITPEIIELWEGKIDLEQHNGNDSGKLPLPATYLIDTDGTIRFAHLDAEYRVRAEPAVVIARLRELQEQAGSSQAASASTAD